MTGEELPRPDWPEDWSITDVTPTETGVFLGKLGDRDPGVVYRLPTNAEWEYAARADQPTDYFFGDDLSQLHHYGNCNNFMGRDYYDGPAPVGSYKPNAWGLYDVHGNVAEWVSWPADVEPTFDNKGEEKALRRGGSFDTKSENCGFASSYSDVQASDNRQDTGFRVVRELPGSEDDGS